MNDIRMIALDLDGTTLTRGHISPRTRRALEAAIEKGVHVVIATGRVFSALPDDIFQIKGLEYVITSNGAVITELRTGSTIYENCIGAESITAIEELLQANPQFPVEVFTAGKAFIGADIYEELKNYGPASEYISRSYTMRTRNPVENILKFMKEHGAHIENINIQFGDQNEKARMRKELEQIAGITLTSSMANNIEIGGATTSKASGLAALSGLTGVGLGDIMACGDSHNDMAMLAEAGFSVAMGNGAGEVKELADYVAPSNEEEGVADAVERFVLDMKRPGWQVKTLCVKNRILSRARRIARRLLRRGRR